MKIKVKAFTLMVALGLLAAFFAGTALAYGPGYKYGSRWGSYYTQKDLDRGKVEKDAKALLAKVSKGKSWTSPRGVKHIPLLVGGNAVGDLWKDVNLKSVEIGVYWAGRYGVKVELVANKEVVGMIWLNE